MAAAISAVIDPTKSAKYPVKLGDGLQKKTGSSTRLYSSIKYNHKPNRTAESTRTTLAPSDTTTGIYDLKIEDQNDHTNLYKFKGSRRSSDSFALVYDPAIQGWTLERVDTSFVFNLTSMSSDTDPKHLAAKYPQLELDIVEGASDVGEDILADGDDEDVIGDDDNPYDYRHFIKRRRTTSSPDPEPLADILPTIHHEGHPPRTTATTTAPDTKRSSSSTSRPPKPKPKSKPKPRTNAHKKTKTPPPPAPAKDEDADNEDSDDGGLTIEMDPETRPRRQLQLGADLVRPASAAPISLRSAASSVSPPLGPRGNLESDKDNESESGSDNEDEDVEGLRLEEAPPTPGHGDGHGDGDAEDELEAELAQALESQDVGGGELEVGGEGGVEETVQVSTSRRDESSSESEEE
ncbi:hypothetical protein MMC16_002878 [Acarospora aff. strigata]|nr:hypothetical protein [Acarospora aff. strigata]